MKNLKILIGNYSRTGFGIYVISENFENFDTDSAYKLYICRITTVLRLLTFQQQLSDSGEVGGVVLEEELHSGSRKKTTAYHF